MNNILSCSLWYDWKYLSESILLYPLTFYQQLQNNVWVIAASPQIMSLGIEINSAKGVPCFMLEVES